MEEQTLAPMLALLCKPSLQEEGAAPCGKANED